MRVDELQKSRILVTGATGFLGRALHSLLSRMGCPFVRGVGGYSGRPGHHGDRLPGYDLTDTDEIDELFGNASEDIPFDLVFHLAGHNGGIGFNEKYPADIFLNNTLMGLNLLRACAEAKVKKVVTVVASCAYPAGYGNEDVGSPDFAPMSVMSEKQFFHGRPHPSVAAHAYAKRNLQLASEYLFRQHGLNAVCVCPTTLYGPGDSFDFERTKVVGGLVRRFVDAKDYNLPAVRLLGTGKPMRELMYVDDAARLLVECMMKYDDSVMPLNLGTGQELSVKDIAEAVAREVLYDGDIIFDTTKPDGQFRKRLDLSWMKISLGPFTPTPLSDGLKKTIEYYRSTKVAK